MKLHRADSPGQNRVTAYGPGYVAVNGVRHETHLLMTAEVVEAWRIDRLDALGPESLDPVLALQPEIVLLGTGPAQRFPRPEQVRTLTSAGIGVEVMDSAAACRTYNILMAEGRRVVAAIFVS